MYGELKSIKTFQKSRAYKYLTFSNKDGKSWTVPIKNMKTGLEIYEPSGRKGKILKRGMPILSKIGVYKMIPDCMPCNVNVSDTLQRLLKSIYSQYEIAIFWGTPSTDQKVTIQIFNKKTIQGYCKIGNTDRVCYLFQHEEYILNELERLGVVNVPRCKGIFALEEHEKIFLQTTMKCVNAKVIHEFGKLHETFLKDLFNKTKEQILFEKSDFYESLKYIKNNVDKLNPDYQESVLKTVNRQIEEYKGKKMVWGVSHRDFTPWNTCVVNKSLFVFDFEYAHRYAPEVIDKWHFYTQTAIYERRLNPDEIANEFMKNYKTDKQNYIMYLLDNISLYVMRGEHDDIEIANQRAHILYKIEMCS